MGRAARLRGFVAHAAAPPRRSHHARTCQNPGIDRTLRSQSGRRPTPHDKTLFQRQIEATDRLIDRLVYELYELTEGEIAVMEGRLGYSNRPVISAKT